MNMKVKIITLIVVALVMAVCVTPVYADGIPPLPHAFYGDLTINDSSAPAGTTVEARGEGVRIDISGNPVVTTEVGKYGSANPLGAKLVVQGDIADGATLTFFVNDVSTGQSAEWHSGSTTKLDLSVTIAAPTPPPTGGGGPAADTTAPTFSNVLASSISETSAVISWTTNELSTSQVEYWTSPGVLSPLDETMVIDHHVQLTGLTPGTTYHYKTMSRDAADNLAVSEEYTFTTLEAPAAVFSLSNLTVHPAEVQPGEAVTVAVHVANTGGTIGIYTVVLKIDGVKEAEKSVTVAAGSSEIVTFSVTKEDAASYSVTVDGLSASFTVVPLPLPTPPAFSVSNLSIQPAEVPTGEAVTIDVALTNTGGTYGTYTVVLKINGVKEAEKNVTIAAGGSEAVTFSVTKEAAGSYSVTVDGLSGSFTVVEPAVVTNWPVVGGIIGAVIVIGLLVFFLVFRRRAH